MLRPPTAHAPSGCRENDGETGECGRLDYGKNGRNVDVVVGDLQRRDLAIVDAWAAGASRARLSRSDVRAGR